MKNQAFRIFLFAFALGIFILSACSDNSTTPNVPVNVAPQPPTALAATSINDSTIMIKWTASTSVADTSFKEYVLSILQTPYSSIVIRKDQTNYTITGLVEGTEYQFQLEAMSNSGLTSTAAIVTWSPATRFIVNDLGNPILLHERASKLASGLQFCDSTSGFPVCLTSDYKNLWNIAVDTAANGHIIIECAALFASYTPDETTEMCDRIFMANSLSDVFDSEAMDQAHNTDGSKVTFGVDKCDLNDPQLNTNYGVVLAFRAKDPTTQKWHYAKLFVKRQANGNFFLGDTGNRYVECQLSYQKVGDVPYAK
jgi:hypothetical protein